MSKESFIITKNIGLIIHEFNVTEIFTLSLTLECYNFNTII